MLLPRGRPPVRKAGGNAARDNQHDHEHAQRQQIGRRKHLGIELDEDFPEREHDGDVQQVREPDVPGAGVLHEGVEQLDQDDDVEHPLNQHAQGGLISSTRLQQREHGRGADQGLDEGKAEGDQHERDDAEDDEFDGTVIDAEDEATGIAARLASRAFIGTHLAPPCLRPATGGLLLGGVT